VLLVLILGVPGLAGAQGAAGAEGGLVAPGGDLQLRIRRDRAIVLPKPPSEQAIEDAAAVRRELGAEDRRDAIVRETLERHRARPDLDHSVVSGIQAQRLLRALGR
jgi:hypothetical protein